MNGPAHIFVDNSNVLGGAQQSAKAWENAPWPAVRIHHENFFRVIEAGYEPVTRVMAGSVPPSSDELWESARRHGYDVALLHRVERDDGHLREQAVDEIVHLKIANAILDHSDLPQTRVLVTGDGKVSEFGTSFLGQAERALNQGWFVEVISWSMILNGDYNRLRARHPDRMRVSTLDRFYKCVTYLLTGDFHHGDHVSVHVEGRRPTQPPARITR